QVCLAWLARLVSAGLPTYRFDEACDGPIFDAGGTINRQSQLFPDSRSQFLVPERVELCSQNPGKSASFDNLVIIALRSHPRDKQRSQPQVFTHLKLDSEFVARNVGQRVLDLDAVGDPLALNDAIQVVSRGNPGLVVERPSISGHLSKSRQRESCVD